MESYHAQQPRLHVRQNIQVVSCFFFFKFQFTSIIVHLLADSLQTDSALFFKFLGKRTDS